MLVVILLLFMVDRKIIFGYNFGAPLIKRSLNAENVAEVDQEVTRLLLESAARIKWCAILNKPKIALI